MVFFLSYIEFDEYLSNVQKKLQKYAIYTLNENIRIFVFYMSNPLYVHTHTNIA